MGCRALANRENCISCDSSNVQQSSSAELFGCQEMTWLKLQAALSCLVIRRRAFGVEVMVLVVCENEIQASCFFLYRSVHQELWQCYASLSVGFHFLLVKCVLKYGVDHTWQRTSASLIYERFHGQESTFYPFTPKVGPSALTLYLQALV